MEKYDIFRDIAERTEGDIYLGVSGGVRTGKSTFIKRFMELMVLPNIENIYEKERTRDEMPQSANGKAITTTEPKFVPDEAAEIEISPSLKVKIRLVDCVGYRVEGALGYEDEEGNPRMVSTPWFDEPIPFEEAAEMGTRKVISEHSTIGIVVTTDGTTTDIPRENFTPADERVVQELKEISRPFLMVLNSTKPDHEETVLLADELADKYDIPVVPINCAEMTQQDILLVLEKALFEFPVNEVSIAMPLWVEELQPQHWLRSKFDDAVHETIQQVRRLKDIDGAVEKLGDYDMVQQVSLKNMDMGSGTAAIEIASKPEIFYQVLGEETGFQLEGDHQLFKLVRELAVAKREYDKIAAALTEVRENGYGVVNPTMDDMNLEEPELIRQGSRFGVRLRASAPSIHMINAKIQTEITPIIGTEKQCEELVRYMLSEFEENPGKIWNSEIFGKSVNDLVREGIQNKLQRMPENAQGKLQETVQRIINDGSGGLICIII
ncbi:MAG: stage IV sporulation protein A [Firmicutes bacterium]|nr:stage IV sporulation protein A [Bacillota bacterium]